MSGYASLAEVREVITATLYAEGRDPKAHSIAGIARDAFYSRGGRYGYGAREASAWHDAVAVHVTRPHKARMDCHELGRHHSTDRVTVYRGGGPENWCGFHASQI